MTTKANAPTDAELRGTLGSAHALWSSIVRMVEGLAAPLDGAWKPSKAAFGRICLLQHGKRTLLYLTPEDGSITVAIVLGERAYGLAMASSLSPVMKQKFAEARPYAEGRGIRFSVSTPGDISTIEQLVKIKLAPPTRPSR